MMETQVVSFSNSHLFPREGSFFMKCVHECISKREGEQQGLGKQEEQIQ